MSRLLVIDDDPSVTRLLEEHLTNEGHEVTVAHFAEEGFKHATSTPPELIFLDVMLPDATGFQMVGRFRENPITRSIPIIMMTGSARFPNQQLIGKSMGANDYILKPFNVLELGDRVRHLIEISEQNASKEQPLTETIPAPITIEPDQADTEPEMPRSEYSPSAQEQVPTQEQVPVPEVTTLPDAAPQESFQTAYESTLPLEPVAEPKNIPSRLFIVAILFTAHVFLGGAAARFDSFQTMTSIAAGWALALGLLIGVSALFRIQLELEQAFWILGWTSIPIVVRAIANLFGVIPNPFTILNALLWLRPLDVFDLAAGIIFSISYQRLLKVSTKKWTLAVLTIALAWIFCARGYLRPF